MLSKRLLVASTVLLVLGSAGAAPIDAKTIRAPWALLVPEEVGFDANGTGATLAPLGDVDGDGYADVLAINEEGEAFALAGPGLERIIWKAAAESGWVDSVPDVDGDGVRDLWSFGAPSYTNNGQGVGQQGVYASQQDVERDWPEPIMSGATGELIVSLRDGGASQGASARVTQSAGPAFTSTYVALTASQGSRDLLVGPGQVWGIDTEAYSASGYTINPVEFIQQGQAVPTTTTLTRSDLAGQAKFVLTFDDPARVLLAAGFVDVDRDDVVDVVAVTVPRPVNVERDRVSLGSDEWVAHSGVDGSVLWKLTGEPAVRQVSMRGVFMAGLGDLDGDGSDELMAAEYESGSTAFSESVRVLSGKDGSTLLSAQGEAWFMPYGDIDADGKAEFLTISEGANGYSLEISNLSGKIWSLSVSEYSEPVNVVASWDDWSFTDVTGDGVPDILLWDWTGDPWEDDGAEAVFSLVDGATGQEVWQRNVGAILGATADADTTGDGLPDLAYVAGIEADGSRSGYLEGSNHSVSVFTHRGTDGKAVWNRIAMDPTLAGHRNLTGVDSWPMSAGDVDGDGHDDLLIEMWKNCGFSFMLMPDGSFTMDEEEDCEAFAQWLVISGRDGGLLHTVPALVQAGGGDPLPPVERGEAFQEVVVADKDSPLPLAIVGAGLLAAVMRRRR